MVWTDELKGKLIGLDTSPVIYFIEEHPSYSEIITPFFEALENSELSVVTSTITLLEVLVHPIRYNDANLANKYRDTLQETDKLFMITLSPSIAEEASRLCAIYNLRTADAIQMATALYEHAEFFLTNDKRLASVPDIKVLLLDDLKAQSTLDKPEANS